MYTLYFPSPVSPHRANLPWIVTLHHICYFTLHHGWPLRQRVMGSKTISVALLNVFFTGQFSYPVLDVPFPLLVPLLLVTESLRLLLFQSLEEVHRLPIGALQLLQPLLLPQGHHLLRQLDSLFRRPWNRFSRRPFRSTLPPLCSRCHRFPFAVSLVSLGFLDSIVSLGVSR